MDHTLFARLEEASHAGDVNLLRELLKKDKLLLNRVVASTSVRDNPLHIAAILGHDTFAHDFIRRKPELATEFNGQGLSPLHLAAAHDHVTVVKELLMTGSDLCLLKEKHEGLLPLHVAVIKGRAVVVKMLVEVCEDAMHVHTNDGETILHLAVTYFSFNTVEFLIDRVRDLNAKDKRGNTVLHLAITNKQLSFSTPLDVLLDSRLEYGDLVLGEIIRAAGGKTAAELLSNSESVLSAPELHQIEMVQIKPTGSNPTGSPTSGSSNTTSSPDGPNLRTEQQEPRFSDTKISTEEMKNRYNPDILMVVATLVATVTFQAALNPPGGVQPDDDKHQGSAGQAVLEGLASFLIYDMFALFSSVSVILLFLCVVPRKRKFVMKFLVWLVWSAALSMGLAFTIGIDAIYDHWDLTEILLHGWFAVFRLGISWVLIRLLIFLLEKSGLINCKSLLR